MKFLIPKDYLPYIKSDNLVQIHQSNPDLLESLEKVALQKIQSYTSRYFNSDCLFPVIMAYDNSKNYQEGTYVTLNDKIYVAEQAINTPHSINDFKEEDPRSPLLIDWTVSIVLYKLHSRIAPNQVPVIRNNEYRDVLEELKEVKIGHNSGLPQSCRVKNDEGEIANQWSSHRKINQFLNG